MNDQEFDNVTRSLRKSWSRQGTRNLRAYVLELQAMRNELGKAVLLLSEICDDSNRDRVHTFLAETGARVKAHVAAGIGADPQPQIKAKPQQYRDHSNHVVLRQDDWQPCYCWAEADHRIGQEVHQPVATGFDTGSQARVYQYMGGWWVQVPGQPRYAVASKEAGETWARENGYGIVRE